MDDIEAELAKFEMKDPEPVPIPQPSKTSKSKVSPGCSESYIIYFLYLN